MTKDNQQPVTGADNVPRVNRRLPAFKITLEDGSSYITSMSKDTTLEDARDYFLGQRLTQQDETTTLLVTSVDNVPRQCGGQVT